MAIANIVGKYQILFWDLNTLNLLMFTALKLEYSVYPHFINEETGFCDLFKALL